MKNEKKILVIGAKGMLGQAVYKYLRQIYPNTFGTDRSDRKYYHLSAPTLQKDFKKIIKDLKTIDFIINCIGLLPSSKDKRGMSLVNSKFPKKLVSLTSKHGIKVIHISTDAVFSSASSVVYENSKPKPDSFYGKTKLKGEVKSTNVLNIRTSILGLDPLSHKGLLEWAKSEDKINGYVNHIWSGCTTLQFAKLCEYLIKGDNFEKIRKKSYVIHYAPLGPISKFDLIKIFLNVSKINKKISKTQSLYPIDRRLKSIYNIPPGKKDLNLEILELIKFFK
ncbi:MAG: hypothetical protein A2W22_03845 [Candidatus Levybacteria bacterium RBG_16_35_11]|nr:MAG: hypothetical protein A2W22_03845 [Candidatus Levybacteria bacterium RBG_16_35_11]